MRLVSVWEIGRINRGPSQSSNPDSRLILITAAWFTDELALVSWSERYYREPRWFLTALRSTVDLPYQLLEK